MLYIFYFNYGNFATIDLQIRKIDFRSIVFIKVSHCSDDNCRIRLQSEASDDSGFEGLENLEPFDFGLDLTDDSHLTLVRKSSHDSGVEADPSPGMVNEWSSVSLKVLPKVS